MTVVDEPLDPNYLYHGVVEGELAGVEAMKQLLTSVYAAFPDAQYVIQEQVAEGDKVVTRFKSTGTLQVEFMGISPSGRQITIDEVSVSRIAGGRIVEDWNIWDVLGLFRQLGAGPETVAGNKNLVRRYFEEVANKFKLAVIEEVFTGDTVFAAPYFPKLRGLEGRKQVQAIAHSAYPNGHYTVKELIAEGNSVVARWTFRGTHKGEMMGMAPTGKKVSLTGTSTLAIRDRKIASEWADYDALGQWQQLGVIPPLEKAIVRGKPKTNMKAKPKAKPRARPKTKPKPKARRQRR